MENTVEQLFGLLQSGDEALDFLCENLDPSTADTCITVSEALGDLYDNLTIYIENYNIKERHRGREAALNAGLAAGKLCRAYSGGDLETVAHILTYEMLPLHGFLSNELNFWFAIYPDKGKMHEYRDKQQEDVTEYFSRHEETLKLEYTYDVSIMLLCYNKAYLTKIAFESLLKYTNFEKYNVELIIVNNGSDDNGETSTYIENINDPRVKKVDLKYPLGYNGYSLGPLAAGGRYFIEFHSDVIATENWLENLMGCISSNWRIGAVVAASNETPNAQKIPVSYKDPMENDADMQRFAKKYNRRDPSKWEERTRIAPTSGYITPTGLYRRLLRDPWLYYGQFTDDDMSMFLRRSGFRQVVAKDTFLHHFGSQTSMKDIVENDSVGQMKKRFYEKWGIDAWYSIGENHIMIEYMDRQDISDHKSFLFIDTLFGFSSVYILGRIKVKGKKVGETGAIVSDMRYGADAKHYYDKVIIGRVSESLAQLQKKYDYVVFHPDIEEYIDKNFPNLLKALHLISKPDTKILFTLSNPAYYTRLQEFISNVVTSKPFEPWYGIRFIDIGYVYAEVQKQGFNCTVMHVKSAESGLNTQTIAHLQAILEDKSDADTMTSKTRLFILSPK